MSRRKSFLGRHPYWIVFILAFGAGIACFNIGAHIDPTAVKPAALHWYYAGMAFTAVAVLAPITCYFRFFSKELDKATTPLPTPAEVRYNFLITYGREPTIEEATFILNQYKTARNEAAVNSAILGAGVLLGARTVNGGRGL